MEYIVHVDPDFFKRIMPEWSKYVCIDKDFAGTACHQESGYLQVSLEPVVWCNSIFHNMFVMNVMY